MAAVLGAKAAPPWRDWLRAGVRLRLYRTVLTAVPKPPGDSDAAVSAPPTTPPPKGKAKAAEAPPPPLQFDVESATEAVADATLACCALAGGHERLFECDVSFVPIPALWDAAGVRMGLEDERHPKQPIAKMHAKLQLHVAPHALPADGNSAA
uniref:Uncharacterized protein n=1 Tax=Chlamydomonas euryale TaxID=1486919 RepID=A0A7R9VST9_9CHLO